MYVFSFAFGSALFEVDPLLRQMVTVRMATHLLVERELCMTSGDEDIGSRFRPYLRLLPHSPAPNMVQFTKESLLSLGPSPLRLEAIRFRRTTLKHFAQLFLAHAQTRMAPSRLCSARRDVDEAEVARGQRILGACLSWRGFQWALSHVMARQNSVPLKQAYAKASPETRNQPLLTLIPWWDLANHEVGRMTAEFTPEVARDETRTGASVEEIPEGEEEPEGAAGAGAAAKSWVDPGEGWLVARAMRPFSEGEELTMDYGPRGNGQLLLYGGYVLPQNPYSSLKVAVPLVDPGDNLHPLRVRLLERAGIRAADPSSAESSGAATYVLQLRANGRIPPVLLAIGRVATADKDEINGLMRQQTSLGGGAASSSPRPIPQGPPALEDKAFQFLCATVEASVQYYRSAPVQWEQVITTVGRDLRAQFEREPPSRWHAWMTRERELAEGEAPDASVSLIDEKLHPGIPIRLTEEVGLLARVHALACLAQQDMDREAS